MNQKKVKRSIRDTCGPFTLIIIIISIKSSSSSSSKGSSKVPDIEIVSLDFNAKYKPTHCCDIIDFDYRQYTPGYFDIIWASPDCRIFSRLQGPHIGRLYSSFDELTEKRLANSIYVEQVLEIITYLNPTHWFIENPYHGYMNELACMNTLPSFRFDYCRFGFDYQKPTRIWTNRTDLVSMPCNCTQKKHKIALGHKDGLGTEDRYRIPEDLLKLLFTL